MPDYTVSGDVDSMLRSANDAAIRSAIGVGTTDAPTFLAQTLTGQSLTGAQATSLVNLNATWDTSGTPSLIYARVTTTQANNAAKLLDLGTFSQGEVFSVSRYGGVASADSVSVGTGSHMSGTTVGVGPTGRFGFSSNLGSAPTFVFSTGLYQDAPGILAQRNGSSAPQAFRVYNAHYGTTSDEWGAFDWKTSSNTLLIGTQRPIGGTSTRNVNIVSTAQVLLTSGSGYSIDFAPGGTARWHIHTPGNLWATTDNAYDIGASGANRPRNIYANSLAIGSFLSIASETGISPRTNTAGSGPVLVVETSTNWTAGVARFRDTRNGWSIYVPSVTDATIQVGGTTSLFPSLKRSTTYLQAKLADDSAFTNIQGKLTTDTAYTGTVVTPTGYLTLYDSTGTAYRVPCVV